MARHLTVIAVLVSVAVGLSFVVRLSLDAPENSEAPPVKDTRAYRRVPRLEDGTPVVELKLDLNGGKPVKSSDPLKVDVRLISHSTDKNYAMQDIGKGWRPSHELFLRQGGVLKPVEFTDAAKEHLREIPWGQRYRIKYFLLPLETKDLSFPLRNDFRNVGVGDYLLKVQVIVEDRPGGAFWHEVSATLDFTIY